jgi:hypothetical protein
MTQTLLHDGDLVLVGTPREFALRARSRHLMVKAVEGNLKTVVNTPTDHRHPPAVVGQRCEPLVSGVVHVTRHQRDNADRHGQSEFEAQLEKPLLDAEEVVIGPGTDVVASEDNSHRSGVPAFVDQFDIHRRL